MLEIKTMISHRENYGDKREKIDWIVMHYTGNDGDTALNNALYFKNNIVETSSHYFVDDNNIYQTVEDDYVAYHCGAKTYVHPECRNINSIGIEMCDNIKDGEMKLTKKTFNNAAELVATLCKEHNIPTSHIIRHYDVTHKLCPAYWIDNDGIELFRNKVEKVLHS